MHCRLPFGRLMLGLRKLGDVVAGILERDELASAGQRDWIVKRSLPAANGGVPGNQLPESCNRASRRLAGIPRERVAGDGRPSLSSYLPAKSSRRFFMNGSAFSARLRQRSACSFKNELSIFHPNATNALNSTINDQIFQQKLEGLGILEDRRAALDAPDLPSLFGRDRTILGALT